MGFKLFNVFSRFALLLLFTSILFPLANASHADEGILNYAYFNDPEDNPGFKYLPGSMQKIEKGLYEVHKFSQDVSIGFAQGAVDTVTGLGSLLWEGVKAVGNGAVAVGKFGYQTVTDPGKSWEDVKQTYDNVKEGVSNCTSDLGGCAKNAGNAVVDGGKNFVNNYVDYLTDCPKEHTGRCIGKGLFEVGAIFVPADELRYINKLDDASKIKKLDTVADISKTAKPNVADDLLKTTTKESTILSKTNELRKLAAKLPEAEKATFLKTLDKIDELSKKGVKGTEGWVKKLEGSGQLSSDLKGIAGEQASVEKYISKGVSPNNIEVNLNKFGQEIDVAIYKDGKITEIIEAKNRNALNAADIEKQMTSYAETAKKIGKEQGTAPPRVTIDSHASSVPTDALKNVKTKTGVTVETAPAASSSIFDSLSLQKTFTQLITGVVAMAGQVKTQENKNEANAKQQTAPQTKQPETKPPATSTSFLQKVSTATQTVVNFLLQKPTTNNAPATTSKTTSQTNAPQTTENSNSGGATPSSSSSSSSSKSSVVTQLTTALKVANAISPTINTISNAITNLVTQAKTSTPAPVTLTKPTTQKTTITPTKTNTGSSSTSSSSSSTKTNTNTGSTSTPKPSSAPTSSPALNAVIKTITNVSPVANTIAKAVSSVTSFFTAPKAAPAPAKSTSSSPSRSSSSSSRSSGSRGGRR